MCLFDGINFRTGMPLPPGQLPDPNWKIRAIADMNHDGHPDVIWQHAPTGQLSIWLLNGVNLLQAVFPDAPAPGGEWEIVGVGDSNRDGDPDLFWQHRTHGTLAVWHMHGTDLAAGMYLSMTPADPHWRVAAVADLDGDGYSDLVFQHADSGLLAAWYFADATFRFGIMLNPSILNDAAWKVAGPR